MKILITGATGFVGGRLVEALPEADLVSLGRSPTGRVGKNFVHGIDGESDYSEALNGVDVVIHCAARVHIVNEVAADPLRAFRDVNTLGTLNLAEQAARAGARRFIFLSSVKVNGDTTESGSAFRADDIPRPVGGYAISKWEAENGLFSIGERTGMEVVVIRPPLIYGPGVKANFASLIRLAGMPVPLPFLSVKNRRSLVSVDNLVDLILVCLSHPNAPGRVFMVSDDEDVSTSEIFQRIVRLNRGGALLFPFPVSLLRFILKLLGRNDISEKLLDSLAVDISLTKSLLNWAPPFSFDETLSRCLAFDKATTK